MAEDGVTDDNPDASGASLLRRSRLPEPAQRFIRHEASGAVVMLAATAVALIFANSEWREAWQQLWDISIGLVIGDFNLGHLGEMTLRDWVNDGTMTLFFFVMALELKRERTVGQLAEKRTAILPVVAAVGGLVVPAAIYMSFNAGTDVAHGWGIPISTDTAFALGVLALVGSSLPHSLRMFLLAVVVVDDVAAISVIALFYTADLGLGWLAVSVAAYTVVLVFRRIGIESTGVYVAVGALMWWATLESGVHPTIVGVALGVATPITPPYRPREVGRGLRRLAEDIDADLAQQEHHHLVPSETRERAQARLSQLADVSRFSVPPLLRLEQTLTPWTAYVVVPIFALANAGVTLDASRLAVTVSDPLFLGVSLGLLVGKPVGILAFSWLAVRLSPAALPQGGNWWQLTGIGIVAGVGFTMALLITELSFSASDQATTAKLGIFAASILAGVVGWLWLVAAGNRKQQDHSEGTDPTEQG